jgi:hypothetical protein
LGDHYLDLASHDAVSSAVSAVFAKLASAASLHRKRAQNIDVGAADAAAGLFNDRGA